MAQNEHRRESDEEAFKYSIVAQQAEIKIGQAQMQASLEKIEADISHQNARLETIEATLWGYGKDDKVGLLEKMRSIFRTAAWIIGGIAFIASAAGRLIAPLYDKYITDWAYNSPSEKWAREEQRPKVKVYKIYRKSETDKTE